jgi:hypothetical protein
MRKLTVADIKDLREYERERDEFRRDVISMKKRRRIKLGDIMSIVFENTSTMRFQIQEMARAEKMLRDEQIAHEVDTYNELIPDAGQLSATLFIEIDDTDALRVWLPRLVGVEQHVRIVVGGEQIDAIPLDTERLTREDTTPTVHYLKFGFTPEQQQVFAHDTVRIVVNHPEYHAEAALSDEQRGELVADFAA